MCTVKTNQFYIPGETNIIERLRKASCDSGTITTLSFIFQNLRDDIEPYSSLRTHIKTKILNFIELSDLNYMIKVFTILNEAESKRCLDNTFEEYKDGPPHPDDTLNETALIEESKNQG